MAEIDGKRWNTEPTKLGKDFSSKTELDKLLLLGGCLLALEGGVQLRELVGAALIAQVHVWIRLVTEGRIGSGAHALAVGGIGAGRGRSRSRSRTLVWSARLVVVETHVAVLLCCPLFGQTICYAALAHDEEEDDAGAREDAATDMSAECLTWQSFLGLGFLGTYKAKMHIGTAVLSTSLTGFSQALFSGCLSQSTMVACWVGLLRLIVGDGRWVVGGLPEDGCGFKRC